MIALYKMGKSIRAELRGDIQILRAELRQDQQVFRTEVKNEIEKVSARVDTLRKEMREDHNTLRVEVSTLSGSVHENSARLGRIEGHLGITPAVVESA